MRVKRKVVRAYKNLTNAERCPVELYKKYFYHVPKEISDGTFYLRALHKPRGKVWHYNKPMGRETLADVVKKIMTKAEFEGISQTSLTGEVLPRGCTRAVYQSKSIVDWTTGHQSFDGLEKKMYIINT